MEEIMAEVKTESFHKLEAVTMAPSPPNSNEIQGLNPTGYAQSNEEIRAACATLLQQNVSNQSFGVFISYQRGGNAISV